jgi:hypothetical protein
MRPAAEPAMPAIRGQSLEDKRQETIAVNRPTAASEVGSAGARSRADSTDRLPEAAKRADYQAMAKKPLAPASSSASGTQEVSKAEPRSAAKIAQSSGTKQLERTPELKKTEVPTHGAPAAKSDNDLKTASPARNLDPAATRLEKRPSGGETTKTTEATSNQSGGGTQGNVKPAALPAPSKSPEDNRTAGITKSTRAQTSALSEAQPKIERKVPATTSEQQLAGKSSASSGLEPQRHIGSGLPQSQIERTKAEPVAVEKKTVRSDPQSRVTANTAGSLNNDANKSAPLKNNDVAAAKPELKAPAVAPVLAARSPERIAAGIPENSVPERIAVNKKVTEASPNVKSGFAAPSKRLEGYIIQLAFTDKADARGWAERMEQRGYIVSVTEAGGTEAVRVRVGNFSGRDEADRQLMSLKQEGLSGIVINLPQAYQPDAAANSGKSAKQ